MTKSNWIFLNFRELKINRANPPSKNKHKQTKTTYIFTEGPLPLNAFQSNATDACNRTNVIGCWLRAIWRTRSPSSHPPPQLSGSSLGVLKFLKWYGQGRCHIRHKGSLSPRVPPRSAVPAASAIGPTKGSLREPPKTKLTFPQESSSRGPRDGLVTEWTGNANSSEITALLSFL